MKKGIKTPITPGHEFSCEIVELGEGTVQKGFNRFLLYAINRIKRISLYLGAPEGLEVGDLTVAEQIVPCYDCAYCKR